MVSINIFTKIQISTLDNDDMGREGGERVERERERFYANSQLCQYINRIYSGVLRVIGMGLNHAI